MSWPNWTGQPVAPTGVPNPAVLPNVQYNPEQWAQLQQQNWQQWAQWQQQYQQWQQQYGAEYQKSINALATPSLPNVGVPPPLPLVENKPPPPPEEPAMYNTLPPIKGQSSGYSTLPPSAPQPTQPTQPNQSNQESSFNSQGYSNNRPKWQQNKRPYNRENEYDNSKKQMVEKPNWNQAPNQNPTWNAPANSYQSAKPNIEELSEAEKKFDKEFAAWEEQFNKWKQQNATHPDKEQYREYEKKWESWRNSLLDRREQMRRKRLNLLASTNTSNLNVNIKPFCNFNEPPPATGGPNTRNALGQFMKPPPNLNNEPLAFKAPASFPGEEKDNDFLKSMPVSDGIPGLDLAKDGDEKNGDSETEENNEKAVNAANGPDFEAISKNINSLLGDQKLLNMLSMVSQNQSCTASNTFIDSQSRVSEQSTQNDGQSYNDQSNNSFEERSNHGEGGYNAYESVNNFDDQTRSSFTLGPNDHEFKQDNYNPNWYNNKKSMQPEGGMGHQRNNFGRDQNSFSGINNNGLNSKRFESNFGQVGYGHGNKGQYNDSHYEENYKKKFDHSGRAQFQNSGNFNKTQYDKENYDDQWAGGDCEKYQGGLDENLEYEGESEEAAKLSEDKQEEVLFEPASVIDYNHKPAKPVDSEVLIEPIHMFDYRHKSLNRIPLPQRPKWLSEAVRNMREFDPLASRMYDRRLDGWRDMDRRNVMNYRDNRWMARPEQRVPPKEKPLYENRIPYEVREQNKRSEFKAAVYKEVKRPQHNIFAKKTEQQKREQKRDDFEELSDDEMDWNNDSDGNEQNSKQDEKFGESTIKMPIPNMIPNNSVTIEDLVVSPGRYKRPPRLVIILRGPPGSGKTHLAKLIKDKEVELGGSAPRILSLDDYFMVEQEKTVVEDGKTIKVKEMVYEYEAEMEQSYRTSMIKSFKKTITDGFFSFIIVDNVNDKLKYFGEMWSFAKHNGFQVYICQLELDKDLCAKRNVHNRTEKEVESCISGWEQTPSHHTTVDPTAFLQSCSIPDVVMEEINNSSDDVNDDEVTEDEVRSKWDNFDCTVNNLAKLDGVSKPLRPSHQSMEQYLQLDDEWIAKPSKPGQKRVRWADMEEQKQQAKMRAIGFVVGQTDWDRMMDPTSGGSALTQTKYIDRVKKLYE